MTSTKTAPKTASKPAAADEAAAIRESEELARARAADAQVALQAAEAATAEFNTRKRRAQFAAMTKEIDGMTDLPEIADMADELAAQYARLLARVGQYNAHVVALAERLKGELQVPPTAWNGPRLPQNHGFGWRVIGGGGQPRTEVLDGRRKLRQLHLPDLAAGMTARAARTAGLHPRALLEGTPWPAGFDNDPAAWIAAHAAKADE